MKEDKLYKYVHRVLEFEKIDVILDQEILDIRDHVYSLLEGGRWVEDYNVPFYISSRKEILLTYENNMIVNLSNIMYSQPMNMFRNGDMEGGLNLTYIFTEEKLKDKLSEFNGYI